LNRVVIRRCENGVYRGIGHTTGNRLKINQATGIVYTNLSYSEYLTNLCGERQLRLSKNCQAICFSGLAYQFSSRTEVSVGKDCLFSAA